MSVKASSWAWRIKAPNFAAKLVLLALADFSDDRGFSWPAVDTLADMTGMGEKTVRRALHAAEGAKLVRIRKRKNTSSEYTLAMGDQPLPLELPEVPVNLTAQVPVNLTAQTASKSRSSSPKVPVKLTGRPVIQSQSPGHPDRESIMNRQRTVYEPSGAQGSLIDDLDGDPPGRPVNGHAKAAGPAPRGRGRSPVNGHHRQAKRPGTPHHPCPIDFEPNDEAADHCRKLGLDLASTIRAFVNHWTSEKQQKTKRPGWDRSFMGWCDNEIRYRAKAGTPTRSSGMAPWEEERQRRIKEAAREDS